MLNYFNSETARLNRIVSENAKLAISSERIIEIEIQHFKLSQKRKEMFDGEKYYRGRHDILDKKRTAIGSDGELTVVDNLPNNRIVDNQYKKMVNQKTNYLLGQPIVFRTENVEYGKCLKSIFNKRFMRLIKNVGKDSINGGIGWVYVYYDDNGGLNFSRISPYEVIPFWKDTDHTILEGAIRIYEVSEYDRNGNEKIVQKVEVYGETGVKYYTLSDSGKLYPEEPFEKNYITLSGENNTEQYFNWTRIPLVPFKYNAEEIPLIKSVKSLQDGLNLIESNFQDNMEEDTRNTIIVLVNYDGENLGEFRRNLATYGAVKVKTVDGAAGDLKTLQVEVNSENYKTIISLFKKAIIENAMGYDAKDDRLAGNPNQMNIQSMYSDIDLDANDMETEYQAAFEELLWFVNCHLANSGLGDFENEEVEVIFNRDILINESEAIENVSKSVDLSEETRIANHPWVDDVQAEIARKKQEQENAIDQYEKSFGPKNQNGDTGDEE